MTNPDNYIGIAKKAGALAVGETDAGAACRAGKAKILILASDAAENTAGRARNFIAGHKTLLIRSPYTKARLGEMTGSGVCALAAVTDIGIAASFLSALAESDNQYKEAAEETAQRNEKAKRRKAESKAHERNKRTKKSEGQKATRRKSK